MNAPRVRRLVFLALVAPACGCRWAREVTWDLPARENEPRNSVTTTDPIDQDITSLREQRAKNESDFLARNPGARPGGR